MCKQLFTKYLFPAEGDVLTIVIFITDLLYNIQPIPAAAGGGGFSCRFVRKWNSRFLPYNDPSRWRPQNWDLCPSNRQQDWNASLLGAARFSLYKLEFARAAREIVCGKFATRISRSSPEGPSSDIPFESIGSSITELSLERNLRKVFHNNSFSGAGFLKPPGSENLSGIPSCSRRDLFIEMWLPAKLLIPFSVAIGARFHPRESENEMIFSNNAVDFFFLFTQWEQKERVHICARIIQPETNRRNCIFCSASIGRASCS